jgi:hypothetical protein
MVETMLLTTPMKTRTTQTSVPTSRTKATYLPGPESGGGCGSLALSVEAPIDERISVSAWTFFRR